MFKISLSAATVAVLLVAIGSRAVGEERLTADMMKAALRTTTTEEEGFIDFVLTKVDKGVLPYDLVQSTFLWAKKKPRHKFQYFKRGLILRAAEKGIPL
jgi:hypothetical protein